MHSRQDDEAQPSYLQLLLGAQLAGVAAGFLAAILGARMQARITPRARKQAFVP